MVTYTRSLVWVAFNAATVSFISRWFAGASCMWSTVAASLTTRRIGTFRQGIRKFDGDVDGACRALPGPEGCAQRHRVARMHGAALAFRSFNLNGLPAGYGIDIQRDAVQHAAARGIPRRAAPAAHQPGASHPGPQVCPWSALRNA